MDFEVAPKDYFAVWKHAILEKELLKRRLVDVFRRSLYHFAELHSGCCLAHNRKAQTKVFIFYILSDLHFLPKNLHQSPENDISSPMFTTSCKKLRGITVLLENTGKQSPVWYGTFKPPSHSVGLYSLERTENNYCLQNIFIQIWRLDF